MHEIVKKNDSPIQSLVEREKNMQQLDVELPIKINFSNNGKIVQIIHNEVTLNAKVERPLIHQLGGRAWGKNQEFRLISDIWRQKFNQNRAQLEEELEAVFRSNDLSIRYEINAKGENLIYGIVTPHFVDVNQLEFRKKFI